MTRGQFLSHTVSVRHDPNDGWIQMPSLPAVACKEKFPLLIGKANFCTRSHQKWNANREYKIPKTTLQKGKKKTQFTPNFMGKYPVECKGGAPTILSEEEEDILVKWIIEVAKVEFPVNKE
ncbi:hypothetical protein JTB14_015166 [Gonioctena quinquepunctata]|nr:hypothetical protein JTB14_015166 [Gonioctena quinquepunctata]